MPKHFLAAVLALAALTPATAQTGAQTDAPPPKPKLIVAIAVDQFGQSLYARYQPSFTGGLKRLGGGIAFTGYQSHAATETCPGHSTILTGRHPAATGIVANSWYDVPTGSSTYCVTVRGTANPDARGPNFLEVDTLGGWMRAAEPVDRNFSVSAKDRAAIMLAGHHPDAVYWWNDGVGFATSSYAGPTSPAVVQMASSLNGATLTKWRAATPALWPAPSATCAAMEKPVTFGQETLSGHVPPDAPGATGGPGFIASNDFATMLRASPAIDQLTLDFADRLIETQSLGKGAGTDLLAISLSATDYIGHRYGNGGPEMCVHMAALDAMLGRFFAHLDALGVPYVVVLTADHGATDAAERSAAKGLPAMRLDPAAFVSALNGYLKKSLPIDYDPIVGDDPQQLAINVGPDAALHDRVRDAAVAWLKVRPEVSAVFTAAETIAAVPAPGTTPDKLTVVERFHESFKAGRSGDIQVAFQPLTTFGTPRVIGDTVAGHGSPWDYDRQVPILFWWPGVSGAMRPEPIETVDIAPTLAAIAGVKTPVVDGRCLPQVAACAR